MSEQSEQKEPVLTRPLALLAFGHVVVDLSSGALPVMLPLLKTALGLTYTQVGIIVLAQNITSSVIQPLFGYLADRMSMPWLIVAGIFLSGLGMAATGLSSSYHMLLAVVVVTGLGLAIFHPQASKSAHFVSSKAHRGRSMAIFSVGGNMGYALGTLFMGLLLTLPGNIANTPWFFIPAAVATVLVWLALRQMSPPAPAGAAAQKARAAARPPYHLLAVLLTFIFLRSTIHAGLTNFIPLYYVNYLGGSPVYAGYLLSVFLLAGVAGTFAGGTLSDRYGRKTLIAGSILVSWPILPLFQFTSGLATLLLVGIAGFALIASFSPMLVLSQEMMPGYEALAAGLTIGFSVGLGGVGVTVLGAVADHFGVPSVFTVISVLPAAAIVLTLLMPGRWFKRDAAGQ